MRKVRLRGQMIGVFGAVVGIMGLYFLLFRTDDTGDAVASVLMMVGGAGVAAVGVVIHRRDKREHIN